MSAGPGLEISTPKVFRPLWERPARYKGAWGGRGSGKSHDRATACVVEMLRGQRVVGVREVQLSIRDSVKQLVEDKIVSLGVEDRFDITRDEIRSIDWDQFQSEIYGDMLEMGIIDPAKVTRSALQNAASIAGLMLTTEAMVADEPKEGSTTPGAGMGDF